MMSPGGAHARDIAGVTWYLFVVGGLVVLAVAAAIVVIWWRRDPISLPMHAEAPQRPPLDADADGSTERRTRRRILWIGAYIPIAILVVTFGVTVGLVLATKNASASPPIDVDVVGRQWFWDVTYTRNDRSPQARTANEIHLPAGTTVRLRLTSADVAHSFWVPGLDRKMDLIPGRTNVLDVHADRVGTYEGQCAEFCGVQHTNMRLLVVVDTRDDFDRWLQNQAAPARAPTTEDQEQGQQVLLGSACAYCHTISGTNATGVVGPDLSHLASRRDLAAVTIANTPGNLGGWLLDPQHIKPGNKMPGSALSGPEVNQLIAYLLSLS